MEQYLTGGVKRPEVVKKMEEADLISVEKTYVKKKKAPRRRR